MRAPFAWTQAAEPEIDFCIWVLLADGLRVPSFDAHAPGSGELQARGLSVAGWREWFVGVVAARAAVSQLARSIDAGTMTADATSTLADLVHRSRPPNAWRGSERVGDALRSMWTAYEPEGDAWRQRVAAIGGTLPLTSRDRGRLWRAIERERTAGRSLSTYFVRYPAPVVEVMPPDTLIVAAGPQPTVDGFLGILRAGIARLEGRDSPGEPSVDR